jgi:hypothetical protein
LRITLPCVILKGKEDDDTMKADPMDTTYRITVDVDTTDEDAMYEAMAELENASNHARAEVHVEMLETTPDSFTVEVSGGLDDMAAFMRDYRSE